MPGSMAVFILAIRIGQLLQDLFSVLVTDKILASPVVPCQINNLAKADLMAGKQFSFWSTD